MDQTLNRVATREREEIKRTTKQMARGHNKEGGNHLEQESNRQRTMEDIDGGLHPAVDGQSLGERWNEHSPTARRWHDDIPQCQYTRGADRRAEGRGEHHFQH